MNWRAFLRRRWITLTVLLACAGIGYGIYQAGFDYTPPPGNQSIIISGGSAIGNRITARSWSMQYDRVKASEDGTYIDAAGIRDAVIYHKKKPRLHIWADHVNVNLASKDLDIRGHVHIEATVGNAKRTFDTESATWTEATERLVMPGKIRLSDKQARLDIAGATVDVRTGLTQLGKLEGVYHS